MKKSIQSIMLLFCFLAICSPQPAHAQNAQSEPIVYIARDQFPEDVIRELLAGFGKRIVGLDMPRHKISGRFQAQAIEDVMNRFATAYQFEWFLNGTTVYVYRANEWVTRRIFVGPSASSLDWEDALKKAGLYYPNFSFSFREDDYYLVVSGPTSYLELLQYTFGREAPPEPDPIQEKAQEEMEKPELMVFKLKYASVSDRTISFRGQEITTPGVLSLFTQLLGREMQASRVTSEAQDQVTRQVAGAVASQAMMGMPVAPGVMGSMEPSPNDFSPKAPAIIPAEKADNVLKDGSLVSVTADPRTNSILIRDIKEKREFYQRLIDQLDVQVAMVEIEATLVEVDNRMLEDLGVEFGIRGARMSYDFPTTEFSSGAIKPEDSRGFDVGSGGGTNSVVDPIRFMARLRALAADSNAKVLARPTILTQDNVPAYLDLSQTVYLQVAGERVAEVVPVTAGSLLQVTPRVVHDFEGDKVFLRVDIQDGSLASNTGIALPQVQNTSLSTEALVGQSRAILIGGYNREISDSTEYKVPVLGDVPIVGKLFSGKTTRNQRVTRLFLITPRIVENPVGGTWGTRRSMEQLRHSFKIIDKPPLENDPRLLMSEKLTLDPKP